MNKQILIIGGVVAVVLIGLLSFSLLNKPEPNVMDSKGTLSQFPQGDRMPQTSPTQNGEPPQMPNTEVVDSSVFKIGDRVMIETDDYGSVAKKIRLLTQDAGFMPPSGDFPQSEPPQMPTDRGNMSLPGGGQQGGIPSGLMGEITALSDTSITVSGRSGETTIDITETTVFESI